MDRPIKYIKNVAVVLLSGLTLLVAAGAIMAVLNTITWAAFTDMTLKAIVVIGVVFMANIVVAAVTGLLPHFSNKKK